MKTCELTTKDSGQREEFDTGSRRDSRNGKGRYDLISPISIHRLALVCERGAAKYGDRNWERGQPMPRYIDSALRHAFQYLAGDRSEDHLGQMMWNAMAAIHTEEMIAAGTLGADLYQLPDFTKKEGPK